MHNDQIARVVCFALGCIIAFMVLMYLLPYVVGFFAILGMGYLYAQHTGQH